MMSVYNVIQELGKMRSTFEANAFEAGDFETQDKWNDRVDLINDAINYLWKLQTKTELVL